VPSWNELLEGLMAQGTDEAASSWLIDRQEEALQEVGRLRGDRHVLLYGSAFLQKPLAPPGHLQLTAEEINGLMSVIFGMDWSKGLTLILHTPGGVINAADSFVAYLRSKFEDIEVIVPTFAMSAGTMIALAADRIVMGRQSQLGPIDPQMPIGGRSVSAGAIVEQFELGKKEILADLNAAHVWAPILQSLGPALLVEARNALDYGKQMVATWLADYMFRGQPDAAVLGSTIANHFSNTATHKSHGRRIGLAEAAAQGVRVEALETSQELQDAVLTAYHLMTIAVERGPATKVMATDTGRSWLKNWATPEMQAAQPPPAGPVPSRGPSGNPAKRAQQAKRRR
jgi:hypothetical protein